MDIRPLKISYEDPLEIYPVADAVGRKEFEPCLNMLPHTDGEVLDDEVIIIHSSGSVGELEVFEPYTRIRLPGVPCHRTNQFIRAQVQKQSPERSNSRT